jgi:hypothetical protein
LAPGISGQYAMCQRPARSTTPVNSFRICPPASLIVRLPGGTGIGLHPAPCREGGKPVSVKIEQRTWEHKDSVGTHSGGGREGAVKIIGIPHLERLELHPQRRGCLLNVPQQECAGWLVGLPEDRHPRESRNDLPVAPGIFRLAPRA